MGHLLFFIIVGVLLGLGTSGCNLGDPAQEADRPPYEEQTLPASSAKPEANVSAAPPITEEVVEMEPIQTSESEPSSSDPSSNPTDPNLTETEEMVEPSAPAAQGEPDGGETEKIISLSEIKNLVKANLATILNAPAEQIQVTQTISRTWADQGLGCAARKGLFEPKPVPGYQIVLAYGDETFMYHTDRQGHFIRCLKPDKPLGPIK